MLTIRPAEPADDAPVAAAMRAWDRRECAAFGFSPRRALRFSREGSVLAWTADVAGEPVAMFGVSGASLIDSVGRPWMLATDAAYRRGRDLVRLGPGYVAAMRERYRRLENFVHRDNLRARRMLGRWGFVFDPEASDVGGEPFVRFHMEP